MQSVLVADDDPDVRQSISTLLEDAGYKVIAVANGKAALSYLCQNERPAVVLLDVLMPGLNAWELIAEMGRREKLANIPVLGMTGLSSQLGAPVPEARMIRKPFDPAALVALVHALATPGGQTPPVPLPDAGGAPPPLGRPTPSRSGGVKPS